jgi:hypothetical protein
VTGVSEMTLYELAALVRRDWRKVNYAAEPYLAAMESLSSIDDAYFQDSGRSVVAYFLNNATTWRGDTAREVKAELRRRLGR